MKRRGSGGDDAGSIGCEPELLLGGLHEGGQIPGGLREIQGKDEAGILGTVLRGRKESVLQEGQRRQGLGGFGNEIIDGSGGGLEGGGEGGCQIPVFGQDPLQIIDAGFINIHAE